MEHDCCAASVPSLLKPASLSRHYSATTGRTLRGTRPSSNGRLLSFVRHGRPLQTVYIAFLSENYFLSRTTIL